MKRIFWLAGIVVFSYHYSIGQVAHWEKIGPAKAEVVTSKQKEFQELFKNESYSLGSEKNPAPRLGGASWQGPDGSLWVFGGVGLDEEGNWGLFQDMWKYNPEANEWTLKQGARKAEWEKKSTRRELPSARKDAISWADDKGNLWLYGGRPLGDLEHLDDMWVFDTKKETWEKVSGEGKVNQQPNWGKQNTSESDTRPGSRSSATTWADKQGNLWLFGGISYETEMNGKSNYYNDLWKFNTSSKRWTWVKGSSKANSAVVSDKKSEEKSRIEPGPRSGSIGWVDEKSGQLWLYGGYGYDSTATQLGGLSDLWSYSIKSGEWTLVQQPKSVLNAEPEIVTSFGSTANNPGFRVSALSWTGNEGEFYLLGGHNLFGSEEIYMDKRIWKYVTAKNTWELLPLQGTASIIGAGSSFKDQKGNVYLFGGEEFVPALFRTCPTNSIWKLVTSDRAVK